MDPVVGAQPVPLSEGLNEALEERRSLSSLIPLHVSWSPDGTTIAFTTRWAGNNNQVAVWTIRSDGSELRHVFEQGLRYDSDARFPEFFGICWSPTGEEIAIATGGDSRRFDQFLLRDKIGLIALDGIEIGAIGAPLVHDFYGGIDWANGVIYFTDDKLNLLSVFSNFHLRTVLEDLRTVFEDGSGLDSLGVKGYQPEVSPDGTALAYRRGGTGRDIDDEGDSKIYLMDLASREEVFIAYGMSPTWSPDSQKIVFIDKKWRDPNIKINIINTDGTGLETIYEYIGDTESYSTTTQFVDIDWSPWLDDIATGVSPTSWGSLKRELSE